jgi:hypothetical protein
VEAYMVMRCQEPHTVYTIGSNMAVKLLDLRAGLVFLVLISVKDFVNLWAIVWLKIFGKLKKFNDFLGTPTRDLPTCSTIKVK